MKPPDFEYVRAASVEEAVGALAAAGGEGKILAGGQSLVPLLNFRLTSPSVLVDINRVAELNFLETADDVLRIGAVTRTRELELSEAVRSKMPLLGAAATWVGHVQ